MNDLRRDIRIALRSLARSPVFTTVAILALGIGLGLSTTMFAVLDAVLVPRPAYSNAARLFWMAPYTGPGARQKVVLADLYSLVQDRVPSLDAVVPLRTDFLSVRAGTEERDGSVLSAPSRWFDVVGARLELGRAFTTADGAGVAVVSHEIWRRVTPNRDIASGARVTLGERSYTVLGVLSQEVRGIDAVVPLSAADEASGRVPSAPLVRLRAGALVRDAQAQLDALAGVLTITDGSQGESWSFRLQPLRVEREEVRSIHLALVGAALAVLLIACVNVAHLMLARGIARRRELAIRMALGCGRIAVVRLLLAECVVLASGGAALGAVVAVWGAGVLARVMPPDVDWIGVIRAQLSWRAFALGTLAAVISTFAFGLAPAVKVARSIRLTEPLTGESGAASVRVLGDRYSPLVIAELSIALALLMAGALLLRALHQVRRTPYGFSAETLAIVEARAAVRRDAGSYKGADTLALVDWERFRLTALGVPGVLDAGLEGVRRTSGGAVTAEIEGDSARLITVLDYPVVSTTYLHAYGLPILRGRDFEPGDTGVAVLSSLAETRLYPHRNAVGRMLKLGGPGSRAPWVRIVGVCGTPLVQPVISTIEGAKPFVWIAGPPGRWRSATMLVRMGSREPSVLVHLRHALAVVPGIREVGVRPYTWERDRDVASYAFLASVFFAMGVVGLALAALGLHGVLAYAVTRRTREFAVRTALGADPRSHFRSVVHDAAVMLLAGTGFGAFVALLTSLALSDILVGVHPTDATSLVASEIALLTVGLLVALSPARRAARADPADILRVV